jgi:hypothetical protein
MKFTDQECWQIWCVIAPEPEDQNRPTREMAIDYTRKWLGPWGPGASGQVAAFENLSVLLEEADQWELSDRVNKLAQERRELN